jgi:hypothetical protein
VGKVVRPVKGAEDQEAGYEKALDDRFFASLCVAAGKKCKLLRLLHLSLR